MSWFDGLLKPIMWVVAWIMVQFHTLFSNIGLDPDGGAAWALSIVGLVVVMRIVLIPLFFRQIRASRGMQMLQPELQAIQKKYKGKTDPASREAMSRETMALYKAHGTNPFASCLPILLQSPIFFALFRVLNSLGPLSEGTYKNGTVTHIGPMTKDLAYSAEHATIFGAPLSGAFAHANGHLPTQIVSAALIVAMCLTTFLTQRQLTMKNMPPSALTGPMAQQQKVLMFVMPLIFAFSGVQFPIGVLIYWTTTNLWSMGQQFYTIRRMPAPGSEAERQMKERQARKAAARGTIAEEPGAVATIEEAPRSGQREQPKRKSRSKGAAAATATRPAPSGPRIDEPTAGGSSSSKPSGGSTSGSAKAAPKPKKK